MAFYTFLVQKEGNQYFLDINYQNNVIHCYEFTLKGL